MDQGNDGSHPPPDQNQPAPGSEQQSDQQAEQQSDQQAEQQSDQQAGRHSDQQPGLQSWRREYWRRNVALMVVLLVIWFAVSFGCGILFVDQLNAITILGFPLGFWFAQQGSIYTFVILILVYSVRMDRLDDRFGVSERDAEGRRL